jgi:hypothetical protein
MILPNKIILKIVSVFISFTLIIYPNSLHSQDLIGERAIVGNFIRRMYNSHPFNGVKLLESDDFSKYLISVVDLKKDAQKSENIQSRIASIKAKGYASQFLNGSNVATEITIISTEERSKDSIKTRVETKETLKETSIGFIENLEFLMKFQNQLGDIDVFVYCIKLKNK